MNPRSVTSCHQQMLNLPPPNSLSVFLVLVLGSLGGDEDNDHVQDNVQAVVQDDVQDDVEDYVPDDVEDDVPDDVEDYVPDD